MALQATLEEGAAEYFEETKGNIWSYVRYVMQRSWRSILTCL